MPAWAWLTVLVGLSFAIRTVLALRDPSPWIFQDELLYSELAKSFAATGHFAIREIVGAAASGRLPALISPAWALFTSSRRIRGSEGDQRAGDVAGGGPASTCSRAGSSRPRSALLAVVAARWRCPAMVYTGTIMTENAFFPVFLFWVLALVRALERPTRCAAAYRRRR